MFGKEGRPPPHEVTLELKDWALSAQLALTLTDPSTAHDHLYIM